MDANAERWDADLLRALLQEGEDSGPPITMTEEEWDKVWREANEYHAKQTAIARVQTMLIEGGEGEMSELTREDLGEIRVEVFAKLADEKPDSPKPNPR